MKIRTKLSQEDIETIADLYRSTDLTQSDLAKIYKVNQQTISRYLSKFEIEKKYDAMSVSISLDRLLQRGWQFDTDGNVWIPGRKIPIKPSDRSVKNRSAWTREPTVEDSKWEKVLKNIDLKWYLVGKYGTEWRRHYRWLDGIVVEK